MSSPLLPLAGALFLLAAAALPPALAAPLGATVPPAPTIVSAVPGNGRITITYALNGDGGSPIVGVIMNCGAMTIFGGNNPLPVTGLANGVPVTCRMRVRNGIGDSAWTADTDPITPVGQPAAVNDLVATRGNGQVSLAFTPGDDGGLTQTFHAQCGTQTTSGPASPLTVTGLANGSSVSCEVWASNSVGAGPRSTANAVTPATVPGAPTLISVEGGDGSASITFEAPVDNGGSAINYYRAECSPGAHAAEGAGTFLSVGNLSNGSTYTCSVRAWNEVGAGAPSAGGSVTPLARADLGVSIDNGQAFIAGGGQTEYLIEVHNSSAHTVSGLRVRNILAAALGAASWVCSAPAGSSCPASGSGDIDVLVDLAPNATLSFLLTATITATPELPVSSTVTLTLPGNLIDPVTANNSATDGPDAVGVFADGFE